jgi:hypothetical protein
MTPRFALGQILATPGALRAIEDTGEEPRHVILNLLSRHVCGDWGDLGEADKRENEFSVRNGLRILSAYQVKETKVWVITEADRSATTVLLPEEY